MKHFSYEDIIFEQRTREALERVEKREFKSNSTNELDSNQDNNMVRLADVFHELVDICDYPEVTDAVELKHMARERRL